MINLRFRPAAYTCAALGAAATVLSGAGAASAAMIDPSAYGVAATGPFALTAQPAVDWTAGPALNAKSGALSFGPLSVQAIAVDAGDGFADSHVTGLRVGGYSISSLTASCRDGSTSLAVAGAQLHPGQQIALSGGISLTVGQTSTNADSSTTITALTATLLSAAGTEVVTIGQARCGQA